MSYQVSRSVTTLVAGSLLATGYGLFALAKGLSGSVDEGKLGYWAAAMLITLGAGILAIILIQILFHIIYSIGIAIEKRDRPEAELKGSIAAALVQDELDNLVELKAARVGSVVPLLGFVAALVCLVAGASAALALNLCFLSFLAGGIADSAAQIVLYRRSVPRG